jgi:hypothetical protein
MIRKLKSGQYRLYSRKRNPATGWRRNLGTFRTRAAAGKHERAVQYFKRHWITTQLMTNDQEMFAKMIWQALREWTANMGALAWILLAVVLVISIVACIAAWRWILRTSPGPDNASQRTADHANERSWFFLSTLIPQ